MAASFLEFFWLEKKYNLEGSELSTMEVFGADITQFAKCTIEPFYELSQ